GNSEEVQRLLDEWARQMDDLRRKLKAIGIDLDRLDQYPIDDVRTAQGLGQIEAAKSDHWGAAFEYWRNAILSSPLTQSANITGNIGHGAWTVTAERFTEALVNTLGRRPEAAQWGEFKYLLAGILPGLSRGARNFLKTWQSETP